jgi:Protein kinase domain
MAPSVDVTESLPHDLDMILTLIRTLPWTRFPSEQQLPSIDKGPNDTTTFIDSSALQDVNLLLQQQCAIWTPTESTVVEFVKKALAQMPRICILLHILGLPDRLANFIQAGKTDDSLPLNTTELQRILVDKEANAFFRAQPRALVRNFRADGPNKFEDKELVPLRTIKNLGQGGWAKVDLVVNVISGVRAARKLFVVNKANAQRVQNSFQMEINSLQRLRGHQHIIQYLYSYETNRKLALILSPAADCNLYEFLVSSDDYDLGDRDEILQRSCGCLASALAFIHKHKGEFHPIKTLS